MNISEEDGEFELIEDFGYLLMNKAHEKLPVKLFDEDDELMEIEEWKKIDKPEPETRETGNELYHQIKNQTNEKLL